MLSTVQRGSATWAGEDAVLAQLLVEWRDPFPPAGSKRGGDYAAILVILDHEELGRCAGMVPVASVDGLPPEFARRLWSSELGHTVAGPEMARKAVDRALDLLPMAGWSHHTVGPWTAWSRIIRHPVEDPASFVRTLVADESGRTLGDASDTGA